MNIRRILRDLVSKPGLTSRLLLAGITACYALRASVAATPAWMQSKVPVSKRKQRVYDKHIPLDIRLLQNVSAKALDQSPGYSSAVCSISMHTIFKDPAAYI